MTHAANSLLLLGEQQLAAANPSDPSPQMAEAIRLFQQALADTTAQSQPELCAKIHLRLGATLGQLPAGDRTANLQTAITHFQSALSIYTETQFPLDWAKTQGNLANAHSALATLAGTQDTKATHLQLAIHHYSAALGVFTEAQFPQDWAQAQNNLGIAHAQLPTGDRAQNLLQAIDHYKAALSLRSETESPQAWAQTQNNLGIAYSQLPTGDRTQNLLQSITHFQNALKIRTQSDAPHPWAMTQNNLGEAYRQLPTSNRATHLQTAIQHYEAALSIWTPTAFPHYNEIANSNLQAAQTALTELSPSPATPPSS